MATNKNIQFGNSFTCDFEENTWTFEMDKDFIVSAGNFSIIPTEKLRQLLEATSKAFKTKNVDDLEEILTELSEQL